MTILVS